MTIIIPKNKKNKVFSYLCYLNYLAENDDFNNSNYAKEDLRRFWVQAERLQRILPETLMNKATLTDIGLPIRHLLSTLFSLTIGLNVYIFAVENDKYIFLTTCNIGLENDEFVILEAKAHLEFWKKERGE
ncbi:MAG: hypothetical protein LBR56_07160 [Sporomusaceae bacterium]|jgi:hypothetical protein|nr:hypothetical protein [Sporomusaceae bacterium]